MIRAHFVVGFFVLGVSVAYADEFTSPLSPQLTDGSQRAFPTAEGYGAVALGGRGGEVTHVTNLDNSGPGSLRQILEDQTDRRTVVFDVGGIIDLNSNIIIDAPDGNITVAGQTAPGDGVCLRGGAITIKGVDVIIRHLCTRRGDGPGSPRSVGDGLSFNHAQRSIVDHLSISWSTDEAMEIWFPDTQDITIQYSLFYEPLDGIISSKELKHGYGPLFANGGQRVTFHNNVIAHTRRRSPLVSNVQDIDIINNIMFNWKGVATHIVDGPTKKNNSKALSMRINVINNVYRPGNDSKGPELQIDNLAAESQIYFHGNEDDLGVPLDFVDDRDKRSDPNALTETPNPRPDHTTINVRLPSEVWNTLLDNAGARVPVLDEADALLIGQIRDGSGTLVDCVDKEDQSNSLLIEPCDVESALGQYPVYQSISRPTRFDSDRDGMPDEWELAHGLNPDDREDRNGDMVGDGWTNLEYYLNQLAGDYR